MAIRRSTGLRNAMAAQRAEVQEAINGTGNMTLTIGGAGVADSIVDTDNSLGDFSIHDKLTIIGPTTPANAGSFEMLSVAAGTITIPEGSVDTGEVLLTSSILASSRGGSISDLFRNGYLQTYTGNQPSDPDAAATGMLLETYTLSHGDFTPGTDTNGLNFDVAASGVLSKDESETWQAEATSSGTAGWFRFMSNESLPLSTGTDQIRFDGSIATSGANMNRSTSVTSGTVYTCDTFTITLPAV